MYDSTAKCKLFQSSIAWETFWDDFEVGAVWETFKVGTVGEHLLVCLGHSTLLAASRGCRELRNPAFKRPEGKMATLYKISHLGGFSTKDSKRLEVKLLSHSGKSLTSEDCLQQHSSHSLHFPAGGEGLQPNWEKGWKARRKFWFLWSHTSMRYLTSRGGNLFADREDCWYKNLHLHRSKSRLYQWE